MTNNPNLPPEENMYRFEPDASKGDIFKSHTGAGAGYQGGHQGSPEPFQCVNCGHNLSGTFVGQPCPECGAPVRMVAGGGGQGQGHAVASLVLGIVSIVGCMFYGLPGIICGPIGIVMGVIARRRIREGLSAPTSGSLAKAGLICSWIGTALSTIFIGFFVVMIIIAVASNPTPVGGPVPAPAGTAPATTP